MLTIGITCFREGKLLLRCWESVLNQHSDLWQCVMVLDGGCDPATRAVFDAIDHPRLRKFRNLENIGPYQTRNRAFQETHTLLHYYLDGDDELAPNAIERVLAWVKNAPNADIYYTDFLTGHSGAVNIYLSSPPNVCAELFVEGKALYGASIIRKKLWEQLGGYREEFAWTLGDYDFYMSALEAGATFCHIPEPLYLYIRRPGAVSDTFAHEYHKIYQLLIERHPRIFNDQTRKHRLLALGYIYSAFALFGNMWMKEAEAMARQAYELGRQEEALALLSKIKRDRMWPKPLLRIRRKVSIFIERIFGGIRSRNVDKK